MATSMNDVQTTQSLSEQLLHSDLVTYIGVMTISIWGGLTHWMSSDEKFSWRSVTAQVMSSSFAGLCTYWACQYTHVAGSLTGILCAVAGHMGTPALIALAMRLKVVRNMLDTSKETKETE